MQIHGGDIYTEEYRMDFSANINPLGMPDSVRAAAAEGVRRSENYPDTRCRQLLTAVSGGEQVPEEWILCGNGAADLIFSAVLAASPKRALLAVPGFAEYEQALRAVDCKVDYYECKREQFFILQEDYLDRITPELDLIFLCNPGNPTGLLIPDALLEKIIFRCRAYGIRIVVDECFNGFLLHGEEVSVKRYLSSVPELLLLKAFTKLYAMPGLRLGYGLCSDASFLRRIEEIRQPWGVSLPAQMAGVAAMRETAFADRSRAYIAEELRYLKQGMGELGWKYYESQANYLFFEGPHDLKERCREAGILIRDCSSYRGLGKGYYRIAVRTREENEELLRVFRGMYG